MGQVYCKRSFHEDGDEFREKICRECGEVIDEDEPVCVIDEGMETERTVCESCCAVMCNNGNVIQCDACGAYFYAATLHDEEINGASFTECPTCHKDVVDCLTREEFKEEHRPYRFAVIVRGYNGGQRGYVVSTPLCGRSGASEVIKKLADKVDLSGAANITIAEILLEEDEF